MEDKVKEIAFSFLKDCAKEAGYSSKLELDIPNWPAFINNLKKHTLKYYLWLENEKASIKPEVKKVIQDAVQTVKTKVVIPFGDEDPFSPVKKRKPFHGKKPHPAKRDTGTHQERKAISVKAYQMRKGYNKTDRKYRLPIFIDNCLGKTWLIDVSKSDISLELVQFLKLGLNFVFCPSESQLDVLATSLEDEKPIQNDRNLIRARFLWSKIRDRYMALPTDKNMGCCIISRKKYFELKQNLLEDVLTFRQVPDTNQDTIINEWLNKIQVYYKDYSVHLKPEAEWHKLAKFSGIPKVHKDPVKLRPIVNCSDIFTTPLSKFLHIILIDVVRKAQPISGWVISRTEDFTKRIDQTNPEYWKGKKIYTADIKSLYTEIPHAELFKAIKWMLDHFRSSPFITIKRNTVVVTNEIVMDLIKDYLDYNYFTSTDLDDQVKIYRQIKGIPTGGNCSPELANLFLMYYEIIYREFKPDKWERIKDMGRYLDDLIGLTEENGFQWSTIQREVYHDTIELEDNSIEGHRKGIFLDVKVGFDQHDELYYELYRKPGNAYQYIHFKSYVPRHIKKNFIINELSRIMRRCKRIQDFRKEKRFFMSELVKRGYPLKYLQQRCIEFQKLENRRQNLTNSPQKPKNSPSKGEREFLVIPFNHMIPHRIRTKYFLCQRNQRKFREYLK